MHTFLSDRLSFLNKIAASKNSNDTKLWTNILSQARVQGMSKDDKLAVQIPEVLCTKGRDSLKELEFSVAEIEEIANRLNDTRFVSSLGASRPSRSIFGKRHKK